MLNIELTSPFGQALFEVRASDIAEFLARTYLLVPAGTEASRIDIDAELTSLCGPDGAWRDPNGR